MKKLILISIVFLCGLVPTHRVQGQQKDLKFNLNESGSNYVKFTGLAQIWLRNTQMNDGTTINGQPIDEYSDLSIRRLRFQVYGQITDKVFFYTQFGENNFNYHSTKYTGAFFHDAIIEYAASKDKLSLGAGLTGWSGLTRYTSPSVGSILTLDAPLYQQATNGVNDQFLRKLSVYAKGQLGKLDYRIAVTQPMTITGLDATVTSPTSTNYNFSNMAPKKQYQGYFKYMIKDKESNLTPYQTGSYLGSKSVFNVGAGFIYQKDAMWALDGNSNTTQHEMALFGIDVYYDCPIMENNALTVYAAYTDYYFGKNYTRNIGVDNPAIGSSNSNPGGFGNSFPMVGTGSTLYGQVGFLFGQDLFGPGGKMQPFGAIQNSNYQNLADKMLMYELGTNYFFNGSHNAKISLVYQSRPTYTTSSSDIVLDGRKGMTVMQYQVSF